MPTSSASPERRAIHYTRLRGWRLDLARGVWVLLAGVIIALSVLGLPLYYDQVLGLTNGPVISNPRLLAAPAPDPVAMREALRQLGLPVLVYAGYLTALQIVLCLPFLVVGALIFWRKADEPSVWWLSLILVSFPLTSPDIINALAQAYPTCHLLLNAASALSTGGFLLLFPFIFPDGRLVPRWLRWMVAPMLALGVLYVFAPYSSPFLPGHWTVFVQILAWLLFIVSTVAGPVYRYRFVANALQRQQIKLVVFGVVAAVVGFTTVILLLVVFPQLARPGVARVVADMGTGTVLAVSFLLIPLSIGVAVLRSRLWDIDILISRTLVYAALTSGIVGLYVLTVGYLSLAFRTGSNLLISLVASGVVAVLFQPLRAWLQRGVNRLLFGQRDDPYGVLARLDGRLALAIPAETVLPTIVETVGTALKLPYAAITLVSATPQHPAAQHPAAQHPAAQHPAARSPDERSPQERIAATYGTTTATAPAVLRLPLSYGAETVGYLHHVPRPGETSFGSADRRLLDDLAHHAGVVVHAVRLTDDLQRARERLVTAREEERRRLRRDLHDGLGPQLASLTLSLAAAREFLSRDPAAADTLLEHLTQHVQDAVADVRRLVYALRPPALDDLRLVGALRDQAARYSQGGLLVTVEAFPNLDPLPAAVEVAAYRICSEALTNVVRHAHAQTCTIRLQLAASALSIEIADDGVGIELGSAGRGVGLRSMRERAEELGGSCLIEPRAGGGTRVVARLLRAEGREN
jgi:signal transduction histidine kinase